MGSKKTIIKENGSNDRRIFDYRVADLKRICFTPQNNLFHLNINSLVHDTKSQSKLTCNSGISNFINFRRIINRLIENKPERLQKYFYWQLAEDESKKPIKL